MNDCWSTYLFVCFLCFFRVGDVFCSARLSQNANSLDSDIFANSNDTKLVCNCSYTKTPFCTRNGTCDAMAVAVVLRRRAQIMQTIVDKANVYPGDVVNNQAKGDICHSLRDPQVLDAVLLEYNDQTWEPACMALTNGDKICSLAPAGSQGAISQSKRAQMKRKLHDDVLRCGQPDMVEPESAITYCRDSNYCNNAFNRRCPSALVSFVFVLLGSSLVSFLY